MKFSSKIFAILALAFALRVIGIGFGLPYLYHQDEPIIVNHAMLVGAAGWNPHFFVIPPFTIYFLFGLYGCFYEFGRLLGLFMSREQFAIAFLKDPTFFYLLGRFFLGTLAGTATVFLTACLGKRFFSKTTGLFAALFLTLFFVHAQHSHYIYADIPLTLALVAWSYQWALAAENPNTANFMRAGALLGVAVSIKYTAAYLAPAMSLSYILLYRKESWTTKNLRLFAISVCSATVVFSLVAPFTWLDWHEFISQIHHQRGAEFFVGFSHHLIYSLFLGGGHVVLPLAFAGAVSLWRRSRRDFYIWAPIILIYYAVNCVMGQPFPRYMMPLVPWLSLLAAEGLEMMGRSLRSKRTQTFVTTAVFLPMFVQTAYGDILFLKKDTRTLCLEWIEQNIKPGSTVVLTNRFYSPPLRQTSDQLEKKFAALGPSGLDAFRRKKLDLLLKNPQKTTAYHVYLLQGTGTDDVDQPFLSLKPMVHADLKEWRAIGAQYLIVNHLESDSKITAFLTSIADRLSVVASFNPYREALSTVHVDPYATTAAPHLLTELLSRERLGPVLEVYKVRS